MLNRKKNPFKHYCDLPEDVVQDFFLRGFFDRWYSRLWKWIRNRFTVDVNSESVLYFRSKSAFNKERRRHLTNPKYKWIIHPFSNFVLGKEVFISLLWTLLYLVESVWLVLVQGLAKGAYFTLIRRYILVLGNAVVLADIITRFFIGYTNERTRDVILEPRAIARRYLKTFFFVDLLPAVGLYTLLFYQKQMNNRAKYLIYLLHRLRILRAKTIIFNINRLLKWFRIDGGIRLFARISLISFLLIHTLCCISGEIHIIGLTWKREHETWVDRFVAYQKTRFRNVSVYQLYVLQLSVVLCHLFGAVTSRYKITDSWYLFYFSVVSIFGCLFYLVCIAKMLLFFEEINISETKFEEILSEVENYMKNNEFSKKLQKRIILYYDLKFNRKFFDEAKFMNAFTVHIRMEVLLYSCQNLIREVAIFRKLPKAAVGTMLARLKQEIYLTKDEIISLEDKSQDVYFILYGTCEFRTFLGKEVMHVEDGDNFSSMERIDIMTGEKLAYSVTALEMTEIYKLGYDDLIYCFRTHPEIEDNMSSLFRRETQVLNERFAVSTQITATEDILQELRQGHIIHVGIQRAAFDVFEKK